MKILLTAPPRMGKSTIVSRVDSLFTNRDEIRGIWCKEMLVDGNRMGFSIILPDGSDLVFMIKEQNSSKVDNDSENYIGKYRVLVDVLDESVVPELKACVNETGGIVYIDEIGKAQALSAKFLEVVRELFDSDRTVLATIVCSDNPWSLYFKHHPDAWVIMVTPDNRDALVPIVHAMLRSATIYNLLAVEQQARVKDLFHVFLSSGFFEATRKLFTNAIRYVIEGRVIAHTRAPLGCPCVGGSGLQGGTEQSFEVRGDTDTHHVVRVLPPQALSPACTSATKSAEVLCGDDSDVSGRCLPMYTCDCPLSNGTGKFAGKKEPCSHKAAVHILFPVQVHNE